MTISEIPWLQKFRTRPEYQGKRLKVLPKIHQYLRLGQEEGIDIVDKATFARFEPDRMPLFMGTSMGIGPGERSINFDNDQKIAIVSKSPFSGMIPGMRIYQVKKGDERIQITEERKGEWFSNRESQD